MSSLSEGSRGALEGDEAAELLRHVVAALGDGAKRAAYRGSITDREGEGRGTQIFRSVIVDPYPSTSNFLRTAGLSPVSSSSSSPPILELREGEYSVAGVEENLRERRSAGDSWEYS